jgi:hypothetical protein
MKVDGCAYRTQSVHKEFPRGAMGTSEIVFSA